MGSMRSDENSQIGATVARYVGLRVYDHYLLRQLKTTIIQRRRLTLRVVNVHDDDDDAFD